MFLDTETTGLDPERHEIWEVAYALATHDEDAGTLDVGQVTHFFLPVTLVGADQTSLEIGGFWRRHPTGLDRKYRPSGYWLEELSIASAGRRIVGAVPNFDTERLERLLRRAGLSAQWHYHLVDIEALALGYLAGLNREYLTLRHPTERRPPMQDEVVAWKSDELSRQIGVDPADFSRHTAEGDVLWCIAQYAAVFDLTVVGIL